MNVNFLILEIVDSSLSHIDFKFDQLAVGALIVYLQFGEDRELGETHVALHRLLVLEDRLEQLVADRDLSFAFMTLRSRQTKGQIGSALRAIVTVVVLNVPILSTLAQSFCLFQLLTILVTQGGLWALAAIFLPKADDLRKC